MLMYVRNNQLIQFENYTVIDDGYYLVKDSNDKFVDVIKYDYKDGITMIRRINERQDLIDLAYRLVNPKQEYYLSKLADAGIITYTDMYNISKENITW